MTPDSMRDITDYLQQFISQNKELKFPGKLGLERTRYFLNLLKNPQDKIKIIHIAGTSGKGSTAIYTSLLLKSLGFKIGLHISPYLIDFRERFQINNMLISKKKFCKYFNDIIPTIKKVSQSKFGKPSYFEILTVLAFYIFQKEKIDYAVIETGLGGLFDATNVISSQSKLCVLTKIGYDHMKTLGKTLKKIAFQKAGIIQEKNTILSICQTINVKKIIEKQTAKKTGTLNYVKNKSNFKNIKLKNDKIFFDFSFGEYSLKNIKLNTSAFYQAENCALALSIACLLSKRDTFLMNDKQIKNILKTTILPGRMERFNLQKKIIILDGAHNPQKMKTFLESLTKVYPEKKFSFLLAFKKNKDYKRMLSFVIPNAKNIILTTFKINSQDSHCISEDPRRIAENLRKNKFLNYKIIPDTKLAFTNFFKTSSDVLVITGSIYLLSKIFPLIKKGRP